MTPLKPEKGLLSSQPVESGLAVVSAVQQGPGQALGMEAPVVTGKCLFAARQMLPKIEAVSKEIEGVKAAQDIEFLHRMRVASRRLRAALPLLAHCIPEKKYQRWSGEIKRTARTLGEARDLDVQIEFLKKYRKKVNRRIKASEFQPLPSDLSLKQAISYLLTDMRSQRANIQKDIISALKNFEKQDIIEEIQSTILQKPGFPGRRSKKPSMGSIPPWAADHLGKEIADLLAYEPWVPYPEAVAEHHAMRIAAKRLRYTLELYSPLYRLGLRKYTRRIARLQQILGDLHDCDVWIDKVTRIVLKERSQRRRPGDSHRPSPETVTGFKLFQHDRERARKAFYRQFARYWSILRQSGFFEELKSDILSLHKKEYTPVLVASDEEVRAAVQRVAKIFPEGLAHSEHVTSLALMLFDSLRPLHKLDERCRFLLECGGLLHDIGWKYGKKGHPARSAAMVLSDAELPFGLAERGTIGLIALWHRGPVQPESSGYYQILSPDQQKITRILVSLFRIADGLDSTHEAHISSVSCSITPHEVVCVTTATAGVETEKERALMKADLFVKVFEKSILFR